MARRPTSRRAGRPRRRAPAREGRTGRAGTAPRPPRRPRARPAAAGGQLIPIAVGTAVAVRHLPDSGLIVRMTRGRAWIGVLGVLLVGIVALNVVTLSFAASSGQIDQNIQALDQENSILAQPATPSARRPTRVRNDAAAIGLSASTAEDPGYVEASPGDVTVAAQRLAAAGTGYGAGARCA